MAESAAATAAAPTASAAPAAAWSAQRVERQFLLDDDAVARFICQGFVVLALQHRSGLNEAIDARLSAMQTNPGDGIYDAVPELAEVYSHPVFLGAVASLLGPDCEMHSHRHWHCTRPGQLAGQWHQDGSNLRHHQVRVMLGMYYPHDVTIDMGPTIVMPGTHFRNAPTDRMATYCNIRGQVPVVVKAGSIALTHYDIWHTASPNRSARARHMLKFLFRRKTSARERGGPSWNHDPVEGPGIASRRFGEWPPFCNQSDHYKQIQLRHSCWRNMLGVPEPVLAPGDDQ